MVALSPWSLWVAFQAGCKRLNPRHRRGGSENILDSRQPRSPCPSASGWPAPSPSESGGLGQAGAIGHQPVLQPQPPGGTSVLPPSHSLEAEPLRTWEHFPFPAGLGLPPAVPAVRAPGSGVSLEKGDTGAGGGRESSSLEGQREGQSWAWGANPGFLQPGLPQSPGRNSTQRQVRRQKSAARAPAEQNTQLNAFPQQRKGCG